MLLSSWVSSVPESIVSISSLASSFSSIGETLDSCDWKSDFADVLRFLFLINDCFSEYLTAINSVLYGENVGALPGDFIILLCLCHGDLNGEQPFMGSSVSYLLNGETITAFLFRLCKLSLLFFLTVFKHLKQSLTIL